MTTLALIRFAVVVDVEGFPHVRRYAVQDWGWRNFDAQFGDVGEFLAYIWLCPDGFGEVFSDFGFVNFEGGNEFYVADVVAAIVDVHKSGYGGVFFCVFVVLGSLDEGACAIAYAYECYADFGQD